MVHPVRRGQRPRATYGHVSDWHVAMRPDKRNVLNKAGAMINQAGIRAKVEHPIRVVKRQF